MTYQGGPDAAPGSEPADPWAQEDAAQDNGHRESQTGDMGPVPARTWTRGNTRVTAGGCCLPLPLGCLTTLAAAAVFVTLMRPGTRRQRATGRQRRTTSR